jgi:disulfide bond formation protein DsbB
MLNNILEKVKSISHSRSYWLVVMISGFILLVVGQLYQHVLDHMPCVMCIQVRLWLSLLVIMALAGMLTINRRIMNSMAHLSIVAIAVGLVERSYQLLGTECGFVFGDCGFATGLPGWFAVEEWLPSMYRVETSCGYTPELVFGITMAEALMVFSTCLLLVSVSVALASFAKNRQ